MLGVRGYGVEEYVQGGHALEDRGEEWNRRVDDAPVPGWSVSHAFL